MTSLNPLHLAKEERMTLLTCPVFSALILKYVETSMGEMTPFGTYTNEPSENTAEFSAAK